MHIPIARRSRQTERSILIEVCKSIGRSIVRQTVRSVDGYIYIDMCRRIVTHTCMYIDRQADRWPYVYMQTVPFLCTLGSDPQGLHPL